MNNRLYGNLILNCRIPADAVIHYQTTSLDIMNCLKQCDATKTHNCLSAMSLP